MVEEPKLAKLGTTESFSLFLVLGSLLFPAVVATILVV